MDGKSFSLQQSCMNFICDNANTLQEVEGTVFSESLSEQLLSTWCEKKTLNDESLAFFKPNVTTLRNVSIRKAMVTGQGLQVLRGHRIAQLELTDIKDVAISEIIGCLGEWSLSNLRVLNVSKNTFKEDPNIWATAVSQLKNLHGLNVSFTNLNQEGLEIIVKNLPHLEALDISRTEIHDISPLRKCKTHLKSLSLYNLRFDKQSDPVDVLRELSLLVQLDVSTEPPQGIELFFFPDPSADTEHFPVSAYLSQPEIHPDLVSLDVSGAVSDAEPQVLMAFVDAHAGLTFLGMAMTNMSEYDMFRSSHEWLKAHPGLVITGKGTQKQLVETLKRYSHRSSYLCDALKALYPLFEYLDVTREDVIEIALPAMRKYPYRPMLQWAASALLGRLMCGDLAMRISRKYLYEYTDLTVTALENFPDHREIQYNALQGLCNTNMLQLLDMDWFRTLSVVMSNLFVLQDASLDQLSVFILSYLIKKMTREQVTQLGTSEGNMQKLLYLMKDRLPSYSPSDMMLKYTMASLLSLTDECPKVAEKIMEDGGLEPLLELLQKAEQGESQDAKFMIIRVLCVLSNISEVKHLQIHMVREDFLQLLRNLLKKNWTDVFFLATAILVHLCIGNEEAWARIGAVNKTGVLEDLGLVTLKLEMVEEEIAFMYRSLVPFYPPLESPETPVQMWAIWTIHHICMRHGATYLPMLKKEEGDKIIHALMTRSSVDPKVKQYCQEVLEMLTQFRAK